MFRTVVLLSSFASVLPVITGLISYRRHRDGLRLLFGYFVLAAVVETISRKLSAEQQNNIWLYNCLVPVLCVTFINVLARWSASGSTRWAAVIMSVFFLSLWSVEYFVNGDIHSIDNLVYTVMAVLIVAFSGIALYALSGDPSVPLFSNPKFWFATGMLVFFSVATGVYSLFDIVVQRGGETVKATWAIYSVFNILASSLYAVGFICSLRQAK